MSGWAAVAQAGVALIGQNNARKEASRQRGLQRDVIQLHRDRDDFNREQVERMNLWAETDREDLLARRDRSRTLYDPLEDAVVAEAMEGPDYMGAMGRSDADVAQSYGLAREQAARDRSRHGINVASGAAQSMQRRSFNEEALAKVQGRDRSRRLEDERVWARRMAALGSGNSRNATPNTNLAQLGVPGAAGSMQAAANQHGQNAASAWAFTGKMAADSINNFSRWGGGSTQTGEGAPSTYGVGTYRQNPNGGFSGGF